MDKWIYNSEILNTQGRAGIYMCVKGEAQLLINGKLFLFERGFISAISPLLHIQILSRSNDCEFLIVTEKVEHVFPTGRKFMDIILEMRRYNDVVFRADEEFIRFVTRRCQRIDEKRTVLEHSTDEREKRLYASMVYLLVQELAVEVLALAHSRAKVKPVEVDKNTAIAFQFICSVNMNPTHNRSVAFYAEEAGLSVGHFTRIVKGCTQKTPTEWIIFFTITMAKNLLENSKMSIKEIASELHFPEQFTFRKYFKQHAGVSPKQYRQLQGELERLEKAVNQ
ncbi:MAG: helix-turn-helix transcriptional regulator [Bacteroidaceae bacterium]|nr:helix-turn-helix transcriptional regulator [Bacteroidaceae bacterium]